MHLTRHAPQRSDMKTMTRAVAGIAIASAFALVASGCAGSTPEGEAGGEVTLTLASFNDFGYTDELLAEYEAANPGVTIVHNKAATSNDARSNFFQKLGAGSGLSDVEAVEIDWFAEMLQYSDKLADLSDPALADR